MIQLIIMIIMIIMIIVMITHDDNDNNNAIMIIVAIIILPVSTLFSSRHAFAPAPRELVRGRSEVRRAWH